MKSFEILARRTMRLLFARRNASYLGSHYSLSYSLTFDCLRLSKTNDNTRMACCGRSFQSHTLLTHDWTYFWSSETYQPECMFQKYMQLSFLIFFVKSFIAFASRQASSSRLKLLHLVPCMDSLLEISRVTSFQNSPA